MATRFSPSALQEITSTSLINLPPVLEKLAELYSGDARTSALALRDHLREAITTAGDDVQKSHKIAFSNGVDKEGALNLDHPIVKFFDYFGLAAADKGFGPHLAVSVFEGISQAAGDLMNWSVAYHDLKDVAKNAKIIADGIEGYIQKIGPSTLEQAHRRGGRVADGRYVFLAVACNAPAVV